MSRIWGSIFIDRIVCIPMVGDNQNIITLFAGSIAFGSVLNAALVKAREAAEVHVREAAAELGLPIPAGGIEGLLS